jgi:UMF1 family MFS transporter
VGFVNAETPWFGFSTDGGDNIRATNLLVAVWFAVFSIPTFIFLKDKKVQYEQPIKEVVLESLQQLASTFREIRKYRKIARFLLARLIYNDGLIAIFAFGGIYAAGTFGFTWREIMIFGVSLNIAAGIGAFIMGFLDDHIGGKRMIILSLCGLALGTLMALVGQSKVLFWIAGILIGFFAGPNQSGSRALLGRLIPKEMKGEFYGFFAFSGKATAFLAPLLLGILTEVSNSQRIGFSVIMVFFMVGGAILLGVREKEKTGT